METIKKHIDLLGHKATDKVTGFKGTVSSISFDLYGCIQAVLTPVADTEKGEYKSGHWFDVTRLTIAPDSKVMEVPEYSNGYIAEGKKGAAEKPCI